MLLDPLINRPNRVVEKQRMIQASRDPIYLSNPGAKIYVRAYYGLFAFGMLGAVYGMVSLIKGKPAAE
ncbi:uncharacterized protein C8Q71DRAFT_852874 [Rhodofomes roseus]|uniref:Uncharacterized protein n=1 Tax=Rhodofomes roseus TaxID=34475 RepID=A0A4Y9XZ25_9APHY|nr:uncharacterized protein C8Q71DRAFT_852874 [Rhodofomes roseus]KAH9844384.1 hypothetical protein C8Q71DRAFT_852874 [Rhodofomes roseus]TFY55350.1 hypothetical protein EVJ58_g8304 [Rhodofomes roseus]